MIKRRVRSTLRLAGLALLIAAGATAITALAIQFRIRLSNEWQRNVELPAASVPQEGDCVVVFAPHSDDETLACGGMLALAADNGAKVRVVLVTNGDGFRIAVGRAYGTLKVTPQKCVQFAYKRQKETLKALSTLGIASDRVTFLGYPDRGIAALWDKCWGANTLYVSHATGSNRSPYENSFTPNATYCGESLLADLGELIRREQPTDIYVPHPSDNHSDHYATYCFVRAALEQLDSEGYDRARKIDVHTYLVHRGDWPTPKGDYPDESLAPPYALARADTKWRALELPSNVAELKRRAIKQYKTQTAVERGFLMSFARRNEVFGTIPERKVTHITKRKITVDGKPDDWSGILPAVVDPVGDYVVAGFSKGGDVRTIYLCGDDEYLFLRMDCVRSLSQNVTYNLSFRGLSDPETSNRYTILIRPKSPARPERTIWAYKNNVLEVAVPLDRLNFEEDVFLRVHTTLTKLTVDSTGWYAFEFRRKAQTPKPASL